MTKDVRNDILVCALVLSLAAHICGMFWASPKVMTTVAAGAARIARRGPMDVSKATLRPDPVKIEIIKDVQAAKDAPEVAPSDSVAPAAESGEMPSAAEVKLPDPVSPEVVARIVSDDSTAKMPIAPKDVHAPEEAVKMASDAVAAATPCLVGTFVHSQPAELPSAGVFETPVPAAPGIADWPAFRIGSAAKAGDESEKDKLEKKAEKTTEEVMPDVDEKVVEREKEAVRELVNAEDAGELADNVTAVLSSKTEDGWTYFRIQISPKKSLAVVPKDIVVLIDASGSIGKDRMKSIREHAKAILRTATNSGDRFNLVAFRDRFSYAFRRWRECTVESFDEADRWLDSVAAHGRTDVFSTISSVLTLPRDPARPVVALVVTDGDANSGVSATAEILSKFTALNDGLVSVYMYGVKSSANRDLIDVLTRGNRGESFVFEGWRWKAGSGIGEFANRFRDPVLSDLRLVFASSTKAEAYPRRLRNLYRDVPLEVSGRVPAGTGEIAFSLKGLNRDKAYEGFFRLKLDTASDDPHAPSLWRDEHAVDLRLR